uniref:Uncharacterized protein n=4 Tax=Bos TaxID=9903 RepID=A0AAA9S1G9_BOVIN
MKPLCLTLGLLAFVTCFLSGESHRGPRLPVPRPLPPARLPPSRIPSVPGFVQRPSLPSGPGRIPPYLLLPSRPGRIPPRPP